MPKPRKLSPRRKYDPPEATTKDALFAIGRGIAQLVPVGGSMVEVFAPIVGPPLQRRQEEWMAEVAEGLRAAEVRFQEIGERQDLLDTFLHAGQAASRTSDKTKRAALRNAVVNVATKVDFDNDERHLFVQLIDRFTGTHLRLLKAFQNPKAWALKHGVPYQPAMSSSGAGFLEAAFPELKGRRDFYDLIFSELDQAGLLTGALHIMMTETGWEAGRTTPFGDRFLSLIEDPAT